MTRGDIAITVIVLGDLAAGIFDLLDGNKARGVMWLLYAAAAVAAMFIH